MSVPTAIVPWLLSAAVLLPVAGALAAFVAPRRAAIVGLGVTIVLLAGAAALAAAVSEHGALRYAIGAWDAPLGIVLELDGLGAFMLLTAAAVSVAAHAYATPYFAVDRGDLDRFAPLSLLLVAGLNALFLSGDLFNLYVTLEIVGLAAASLVALARGAAAAAGAMRYLLVTFLASLVYLLGVALLYHATGTLDLELIGARLESHAAGSVALGLVAAALLLKSALFPLHFWLPPAHANAPTPVSALLSALVVKASLYVLLRLWLELAPAGSTPIGVVIGVLGAAAVLWGSVQALRQQQLKLLVAYSTVAQVGYLFLPFAIGSVAAWRGAIYLVLCHALAKSAMFLAIGNIQTFGGDRIRELDHIVQRLPLTMAAFAVAGITLAGLPPSGGFIAKWLLLQAAIAAGQWWLAVVILVGGILAAAYVFRVLGPAFTQGTLARAPRTVPWPMEWVPLLLAFAALALGLTAPPLLALLDEGGALASVEAP